MYNLRGASIVYLLIDASLMGHFSMVFSYLEIEILARPGLCA